MEISIKPGENYQTTDGDTVLCGGNNCEVNFQYVGKTYVVKLPNGKVHFESKKKDETLKAARELIEMKACSQLKMDIND
jgi:hypothetical protein